MACKDESHRVASGGMGGFLNPPTHPEHTLSISYAGGCMSLTACVESDWIDAGIRDAARAVLDAWVAPPVESPEVSDWVRQVLGYFKGCYQGDASLGDASWHAGNLTIDSERDPADWVGAHAGVHLIRRYYPDFIPSASDWAGAYWGQRPEKRD